MTGKTESAGGASAGAALVRRGEVVLKARALKIWPASAAVNWQLHRGEIVGVAGLDGQGQSEFVRILAGVDRAVHSAPQVRDATGQYVDIQGLKGAVRHGVSYVSGDRKREGIFANLSIFENLLMPLYRRKSRAGRLAVVDWRGLDGIFDWEVERLAIRMGERTNKITSLSGGNQQKVLIARAFGLNPNILILNDPARGIDVGAKAELYKHMRDFASLGKSVVYMSSEIEEFVGFCSRVIVFRNGSIFDQFSGQEIHPTLILEAMFGQTRPGHHRPIEAIGDSEEIDTMKIVDFDAEGQQRRDGGRDAWKVASSAYPSFDANSDAPVATPVRLPAAASSQTSVEPTDAPATCSPANVPTPPARAHIKIVEFNQGDAGQPKRALRAADTAASPVHRSGPAAPVRPARPIKIVEFDQDGMAPPSADARSGGQSIKIVDFDALHSRGDK